MLSMSTVIAAFYRKHQRSWKLSSGRHQRTHVDHQRDLAHGFANAIAVPARDDVITSLLRPRCFSQIESTCAVIIGGGFLALGAASWLPYPRLHQPTFLAGAGLAWALIGWQLWRHRSEAVTLGAATSLTLLRA